MDGRMLGHIIIPQNTAADARLVATKVIGRVQYLLTVNYWYDAIAHDLPLVYNSLESEGVGSIPMFTPAVFLGA
jgi:hypothetical protein